MGMSEAEKEEIRREIQSRIGKVTASIENLKKEVTPIAPDTAIGRLTRMDAIQQKSMAESNLRSADKLLFDLNKALEKIDQEDFGLCAVCRQPIPLKRILAIPEAKVCVPCLTKHKR